MSLINNIMTTLLASNSSSTPRAFPLLDDQLRTLVVKSLGDKRAHAISSDSGARITITVKLITRQMYDPPINVTTPIWV